MSNTPTVPHVPQVSRRGFGRPSLRVFLAVVALIVAGRGSIRLVVDAQTNPVVLENAISVPTAAWDIAGAGDPSLQGFASDISINTGETVAFKVKTTAAAYNIDIYRLGYYGGAGARKVASLVRSTPQTQPACAIDGVTGLADCGNWAVSASWTATNAVSGIYIAKLTRPDTDGASHIVFIVRDDARQADVVVQTSDTTWQAYNQYGGGSLYCAGPQSNAGTVYSCSGRATKVSYNRPFDTRGHDATSFLFNAEYPMVRFLEANGYDVKYISGVDTERRAADLVGARKPKAFLSVGHDEYWSAGQRASVEAARNAGVSLAFFSGNEMYWKTRFEPAADGTPYRTLVGYKDTLGGVKLDPAAGVSTGTWRDTRFGAPVADGGRPENALTGQLWTVNAGTTAISVPASMAKLRFWKNTRVENLTAGSVALAADTLGYEWDEALDNGVRPQGLFLMSATTVNGVEKILDFGETVGTGTATHNLTLYKHASGALVFGAGTVQWTWGLDSTHDRGSNPPDQAMQQATINLLADMGAQPGSLQIGADPSKPLIARAKSSDALPPTSAITSPAAGSSVASGDRVFIIGTATDAGGGSVAGVEVSVDGGTTWRAAQGTSAWSFEWAPGALGQTTIRVRAIDDSGNVESSGTAITVSVDAGTCPCSSLWRPATVPLVPDVADPSAVNLGLKFHSEAAGFVKGVRFYKGPGNLGTHVGSLWTIAGTLLATATFANESPSGWQELLFDGAIPIAANTTYVVSYHTNVGHYSATSGYFNTAGADAAPLHAAPTAVVGGNGLYQYGASGFPTQTFDGTNYWVDVVFDSTPDTTAPVIGDVVATPIDSSIAVISWTTGEPSTSAVDYSTDGTFPAAQTQTVSDGAYVMSHSVRLTGLLTDTSYFFRVRSTDRSGNQASKPSLGPAPPPAAGQTPPPPQTFTMPSPTLRDTRTSDFAAGSSTGVYLAESGDGELTLSPLSGVEFSGSALPPDWSTDIWSPGGTAIVSGGMLIVDGARVAQEGALVGAGHSLEFVATFTGDPFQHSGYGQTLQSSFEPMALFSTSWTDSQGVHRSGGSLGVRTYDGNDPNGELRTNLGTALLNAPHRFRIDWLPSQVVYSVDGVPVAIHAMTIANTMRPVAASDFNAFSGTIVVDWVRSTPYASAGSFLSRVFDASTKVDWQDIQWQASTPSGTSLAIAVRTGDSPIPDGTWSSFVPIAAPGALGLRSRYIQYRADLASTEADRTPTLADIVITGVVPVTPPTPPTPVSISIGDVMLAEGSSGTTAFAFPVTLSAPTDHAVTVGFLTADGTAMASNGDYQAAAGEVVIGAGMPGQWIVVPVSGDVYNEDDETFTVLLTTASGGTIQKSIASALILNDDAVPSLSIANATVAEGNAGTTNMTFTVTLSAISGKTVTVNYATANGSALAPADYQASSGALTFAPGTATRAIVVPVVGNTIDTANKTLVVTLSAAANATITAAQATGTIVDDDTSTQLVTTVADFKAGTLDAGTYISETTDGEIILTPAIATEFSGTTLPTGWASSAVATKGSVVVSNGSVKLQGVQIMSTFPVVGVNRSLEFAATFSGAPQQIGGLLLAQFYTKVNGSTVSLYAKTVNAANPVETLIPGNWFNAPHLFRVDWTSSNVVYWIDGSKVATHNVAFAPGINMTVIGKEASKTNAVMTIDWMRVGPYAAAGTYLSKVFDAAASVNWLTMSWTATTPAGTAIAMSYRTGSTPTPDATWTPFAPVPTSGAPLTGSSRYVQFKIQASTTVPAQTPVLKDVTIGYNK